MADLGTKKAGEKIKMLLALEIHSLKINLPEPCEIYIEVQRGKDLNKATEKLEYDPQSPSVSINSQFSCSLKMELSGKKYKKKTLKLLLFKVSSSDIQLGLISIDLSPIPNLKKPIVKRDVALTKCSDESSAVCITLVLKPASSVPSASQVPKKDLKFSEDSKPKSNPVGDESDDEFSSRKSFSEAIIDPKNSGIESESSSSEEECKELPVSKLVASAPKASMKEATPNENSKNFNIDSKETKSGLSNSREGANCVNCLVF